MYYIRSILDMMIILYYDVFDLTEIINVSINGEIDDLKENFENSGLTLKECYKIALTKC